jgi:hypothetical protein
MLRTMRYGVSHFRLCPVGDGQVIAPDRLPGQIALSLPISSYLHHHGLDAPLRQILLSCEIVGRCPTLCAAGDAMDGALSKV